MNSNELRKKFIEFFLKRDHKLVPPSSLVPENDPSVLFTTAGMQQFKRYYTQPNEAPAKNIVTIQPCFRTSDIEEVGDDTHLTFFEMLGNFSFGGYGKKEAIESGYDFITKELQIDPARVWASVFSGDEKNARDSESAKILEEMGIKLKEHPREDNFWGPTGDEGPCGPTVEFYVDDVEIWNLVFNEYYKNSDGSYRRLRNLGVDTGMGLERTLVVVNNSNNVFETNLFSLLIRKLEELSGKNYSDNQKEFRIIIDHLKAAVFAINDDIFPSNKERGYIVRRLIRRAIVKASKINLEQTFSAKIAEAVFEIYNGVYEFKKDNIIGELTKEEEKFRKTLTQGLKILKSKQELTGKDLFDLFQTYGLPLEISAEENVKVSDNALVEFRQQLKKHQELSRTATAGMFKGGLAGKGEIETRLHTATHLLLASLRQVLGPEVNQKGANITAERARFDFSWSDKMTPEQIVEAEKIVNENIQKNLPVTIEEMDLNKALDSGAASIPGFKYPERVKVYTIGSDDNLVSREICGGPHVTHTKILGHFKIIKEESSSSGVRRIKAILE